MKGQDIRHATFTLPDSISEYATKKKPLELFSNFPLREIPCAYGVETHTLPLEMDILELLLFYYLD